MQLILVINCRTRIEHYANKFSTLIPIKPLGLIVHGLCLLGVNVFAIECILQIMVTGLHAFKNLLPTYPLFVFVTIFGNSCCQI